MEFHFACNLGLITTPAGIVLIDAPEFPTDAVQWLTEAKTLGEIKYVINTEDHPDHCQSCGIYQVPLISSRATRDYLDAEPVSVVRERLKDSPEGLNLLGEGGIKLADITFRESMTVHMGGMDIELFALTGHAPGGIGVFIPSEKVVFTADIVFHKAKTWLHFADPDDWLASIRKIESLNVDIIVPGHGPVCIKEYLVEQRGEYYGPLRWCLSGALDLAVHKYPIIQIN